MHEQLTSKQSIYKADQFEGSFLSVNSVNVGFNQ